MNRIKEYLKSKSIDISLDPSNIRLFTAWEINSIIKSPMVIKDMYDKFPLNDIETLEDYYLYFLSCKIASYSDALPYMIKDEHKEIIKSEVDLANNQLSNVDKGSVIRYINTHIEEIFDAEDEPSFVFVTIDFIAHYSTGISDDVFAYLADKHGYLLLSRYEEFEKKIEHNPQLMELIIKTGSLIEIESLRLDIVLDVWKHICNKPQSKLKEIVNRRLQVLYSDMKYLADTATIDNVMIVERKIARFYVFLKSIKNPLANDFSQFHNKVDKLLEQSITEKGQVFTYELPVKEFIDKWKATENWELRLLTLTHTRKISEDTVDMISNLSNEDYSIKSSFIDMVSTNIPTDEYFKLSRQEGLALLSGVHSGMLIGIMNDTEILNDFLSLIVSAISYISEKINGNDEHLVQDAQYYTEQIRLIADNARKTDIVRLLCYGASMFGISLAEKLLRMTYISLVKDELYVPINKASLGELLNEERIVDIFGSTHIKCLSFFLIQTPDSKIGHNLRNSLAHWNGISPNSMNLRFFSTCLWLFIDIMNTVFWYFLKQDSNL